MIYNLTSELQREGFKARCNHLYEKGATVELTEKKPLRTLSQNNYLHLLIQFFALQYGTTDTDYVKRLYYKCKCNADLYVRVVQDPFMGNVKVLRSSAELTTEEMSLSIDRFKTWASMEAGIYLPDAENPAQIEEARYEIERNKQWVS